MNFSIESNGIVIAATAVSTTTALPTGAQFNGDVMIDNPGPNPVHVRAGDTSVTATTASMRIAPGEKGAYAKGTATHIAVIAPSGNQSMTMFVGQGS